MTPPMSKIQKCIEGQDRTVHGCEHINELPNDILVRVLSFLPTKNAIRTSILSTKWRYLWLFLHDFDFEAEPLKEDSNSILLRVKFQNLIHNLLFHRGGSCLNKFRIVFNFCVDPLLILRCVSYAIKHQVKELDLSLFKGQFFMFPNKLFICGSLTILKLKMRCELDFPSSISFPCLETFHLSRVVFQDDESTQRLFSNCPSLQELVLHKCDWSNILTLTLIIPTVKKFTFHLNVNEYLDSMPDCKFKIYARNLAFLDFKAYMTFEFLLYDASLLVEAYLDVRGRGAFGLINQLHTVEYLKLSTDTLQCFSASDNHLSVSMFEKLINLTVVELKDYEVVGEELLYFLNQTPHLESLTIVPEICSSACDMFETPPSCVSSSLTRFKLSSFRATEDGIHLLTCLFKNAPFLERVEVKFVALTWEVWKEEYEMEERHSLFEDMENLSRTVRNGLDPCLIIFN